MFHSYLANNSIRQKYEKRSVDFFHHIIEGRNTHYIPTQQLLTLHPSHTSLNRTKGDRSEKITNKLVPRNK